MLSFMVLDFVDPNFMMFSPSNSKILSFTLMPNVFVWVTINPSRWELYSTF